MNKKITQLRWLAATIMLVAAMVMPSVAWAQYTIPPQQPSNGNGSESSPYQIGTAAELYWFAALVLGDTEVEGVTNANQFACAKLTTDITVNSAVLKLDGYLADNSRDFYAWTPIGSQATPYRGTFDGNNHTISGLYFNDELSGYAGLFGCNAGKIINVGVIDSYFKGSSYIGGVCGYNYAASESTPTIENCYNTGTISGSADEVGGVCGCNYADEGRTSTIKNCYNTGMVSSSSSGEYSFGGVCGKNHANSNSTATIESSYNTGTVSGSGNYAGGVCGQNFAEPMTSEVTATIESCYSTGSISGSGNYVGGICGQNYTNSHDGSLCAIISKCYYNSYFYTGNAVGNNYNDIVSDVEGKITAQFMNGEVCYLLNGGKTDGSQVWYQTLSGSGEEYPNLNKDTENKTVYAGYRHSETTPYCSNTQSNIPSSYGHLHAYNSDASDEANGNHDMSCEQNEQNPYTWTDIDNYSNATAKCNFICSVCNSEVAKDMNVTNNEEKTTEPAKCIEKGHNYYVASLTFNNTPYTNYYTQEVPALGHDDSGDVTFNSGYTIYEKHCKRCSELLGYYATSDGSVVATENTEGDGFTASALTLQDATKYDNQAVFTATAFTYKRTFTTTEWTTWYVPFDLTLTQEICAKYDFSRINNVHQYDDNGDGNVDRTMVESFRQTAGVKLKANYPYLVRAKSNADFSMSLPLTNVVPAIAETNSIDCQSVDYKYTFTGTYAGLGDSGSADTDPYTLCDGNKWLHFTSLNPMRHYLTIVSRNASSSSPALMRSIVLSIVGDEGTTGIVKLYDEERKSSETYDLSGRRLPAGSKPRGLIIENGKVTFKK